VQIAAKDINRPKGLQRGLLPSSMTWYLPNFCRCFKTRIISRMWQVFWCFVLVSIVGWHKSISLFTRSTNSAPQQSCALSVKLPPLIFGGNVSCFAANFDHGSEPNFQKLLKFDTSSRKYPKLAPILYPNLKKNAKKIFHNPFLVKVHLRCNCLLNFW